MIFYIILFLIILSIIIWGGVTRWRFFSGKPALTDYYKELKMLQDGIEDGFYQLGNKLGNDLIDKNGWVACSVTTLGPTTPCTVDHIEKDIKNYNKVLPKIKRELSKIKPNLDVKNDAVIHIRCSDVPFNRHSEYHLHPKAYYKWAADKCKTENIKSIHFILCATHGVPEDKKKIYKSKCTEFAEVIRFWMKEFLPNVEMKPIKCLTILKSYQLFLGCKVLIQGGASPSSFSFIPGIIKGKNFLTPRFARERPTHLSNKLVKDYSNKFPWSMWNGDPIWHSNIDNYERFDYKNYRKN